MEKVTSIIPEDTPVPSSELSDDQKVSDSATKMSRRKFLTVAGAAAAASLIPKDARKAAEAMNNIETFTPETIGGIETFGATNPLTLSEISDLYDQENEKFQNSTETLDTHTIYISAFVKKSEYDNLAANSSLYFEGEENLYQTFIKRHIDEAQAMYREVDSSKFSELANLSFEIRRVVVVDDSVDFLDLPRSNDVREGQWLDKSFNDTDATISSNIAEGYNPTATSAWNNAKRIDYGFIHESMHMWGIPDVYALDAYFNSFPSIQRIDVLLDQLKLAEEQGNDVLIKQIRQALERLQNLEGLMPDDYDFLLEKEMLDLLEFSDRNAREILDWYEKNKNDVNVINLLSTEHPALKAYIDNLLRGGNIAQDNPWLIYRMMDRNDDSYSNGIMSGGMSRSDNKICDFHAWIMNERIKAGNLHDSKTIAVEGGWNFRSPEQYRNSPGRFILKINDATPVIEGAPVTNVSFANASIEIYSSAPGGIYGDTEVFLNDPIYVGGLDEEGKVGIKDLFKPVNVYPDTEQNVSDVEMVQDKSAIFLVKVKPSDDQPDTRVRLGYLVVSDFLLADNSDSFELAVQMEFEILTTYNSPSQKSTEIIYTEVPVASTSFLPIILN